MKLFRYGPVGQERVAAVRLDGTAVDLAKLVPYLGGSDLDPDLLAELAPLIESYDGPPVDLAAVRIGAPVERPGKVVCIGLNYADHARESGQQPPAEPVVFMKDPSTVIGPYDQVHVPPGAQKVDWEVELGVVIGRRARYLRSVDDAAACIAGYCVSHDVSERAYQLERGGQWDKGKSCETFNPLGPWLVTADEVPDPQRLRLWLEVNGQRRQDGSTAEMIFGIHQLVHYLSQFMVLEPGDLINTGTPAGVGLGMSPPTYLVAGDKVSLGIDGLGTQTQEFIPAPQDTPDAAPGSGGARP